MRNANFVLYSLLYSLFLLGGYSQLLCANEKLEWSREPLLDSEPQPPYTSTVVLVMAVAAMITKRDLSIRVMRRFTRKTRGWNRERAGEIVTPNHSRSSQYAARFVARNHAAMQFTAETI